MYDYDTPYYYASIALSVIVFLTNVSYYILELQQRKSFIATLNKFNLLCTGCLLGISGVMIADSYIIYYFDVELSIPLLPEIFRMVFSYISIGLTLGCYLFYIYYRSDAVLWGSRWRQTTRIVVYFSLAVICYNVLGSIISLIVDHQRYVMYTNLLVAFLVWALDVFYTIVFLRHVYNTRKIKVINGQGSESDIVAKFGLFCVVMSSLTLYIFFTATLLEFSALRTLLNFISRIFLALCAWGMILMKLALYRLKGKMVSTLKITGVKDNKISMSSQPLSQAETMASMASNNFGSPVDNTDQSQIETLFNAQTESRFSQINGGNHLRSKTRELEEGGQNVK